MPAPNPGRGVGAFLRPSLAMHCVSHSPWSRGRDMTQTRITRFDLCTLVGTAKIRFHCGGTSPYWEDESQELLKKNGDEREREIRVERDLSW